MKPVLIKPEGDSITGFEGQIRVYLLAGLPGQNWRDVQNDVRFIHDLGAEITLNAWSPIPGTKDYERAIEDGLIKRGADPLLSNPSALPHIPEGADYDDFIALMTEIKEKNFLLKTGSV